jgi:hypothetical protein
MVDITEVEAQHACDVISVGTEFMVDIAGVEAQHACDPRACAGWQSSWWIYQHVRGDRVHAGLKPSMRACDPRACLFDLPSYRYHYCELCHVIQAARTGAKAPEVTWVTLTVGPSHPTRQDCNTITYPTPKPKPAGFIAGSGAQFGVAPSTNAASTEKKGRSSRTQDKPGANHDWDDDGQFGGGLPMAVGDNSWWSQRYGLLALSLEAGLSAPPPPHTHTDRLSLKYRSTLVPLFRWKSGWLSRRRCDGGARLLRIAAHAHIYHTS